jgi:hypothetical protein
MKKSSIVECLFGIGAGLFCLWWTPSLRFMHTITTIVGILAAFALGTGQGGTAAAAQGPPEDNDVIAALKLASAGYSVSETNAQPVINVLRVVATDGAVTMDSATADGTRIAMQDSPSSAGSRRFSRHGKLFSTHSTAHHCQLPDNATPL